MRKSRFSEKQIFAVSPHGSLEDRTPAEFAAAYQGKAA